MPILYYTGVGNGEGGRAPTGSGTIYGTLNIKYDSALGKGRAGQGRPDHALALPPALDLFVQAVDCIMN